MDNLEIAMQNLEMAVDNLEKAIDNLETAKQNSINQFASSSSLYREPSYRHYISQTTAPLRTTPTFVQKKFKYFDELFDPYDRNVWFFLGLTVYVTTVLVVYVGLAVWLVRTVLRLLP
ncbi:hypothetical protein VE03_07146 [Pseudogymnoascus sp. 23342-1-I1]|nr:hypothetical protein VE03_07146 [Pseudogymnoascus sp. 23342-1-I1]